MTLIKEIIEISGGYTDVVDLTNQYFDPELNSQLMERYRPIKAHRDAFAELAKALNQQDKRFYFLSGSYGTGKSHLCLMAANYFANPSNTLEMNTFFKNYEQAQNSKKLKPGETLGETSAKELKAKRKDGSFLVAICRHGLNLEFESTILRAVEDALSESGLQLDTHFKEAIRKIEEWEKKKNDKAFFNDLTKYLDNNYKEWTVEDLVKGLKENKEEAFKIFRNSYKEVTSADFSFKQDNLQDILTDVLSNSKFKDKYKGLVIIYDEFGYALDYNQVKLNEMQEFAQFCATSNMRHQPVIFIGTGHKAFRNHGQVGDAVHYDTIVHRVNEIGLQTQGMEDIIGAIVSPIKTSAYWKKEVETNQSVFEAFAGECKRLKLFDWLTAPIIENDIIQNIYPMHPLSTYALLQLAREVGAENRSLFKFFSPKINTDTGTWEDVEKYSYPWYISKTNITKDGRLNLYTTDLLYEYFRDGIKTDNKKVSDIVRQSIKNYQESLRSFNKYLAQDSKGKLIKKDEVDELFHQILKTILINEIISNDVTPITNTKENIFFALNASSPDEKESITKRLDLLCKIGVLYLSDSVYELRKSDSKDIQRMIDDFKADPKNHPSNLLDELLHYEPNTSEEEYLESKDYNTTYNEDKRLKSIFVTPEELEKEYLVDGNNINIFEKCVHDRHEAGIGTTGYEGTAIYVFCQSDEEIEKAKKVIKENKTEEVVVCIPKKPFVILNDVQTLKAVDSIKGSKDAQDFGSLETAQINEFKKIALSNLRDEKLKWFDNKKVDWYTTDGVREKTSDSKKHDVANKIVDNKYQKVRNKFSHTEFNKSHQNLTTGVKRQLNEALEILMDLSQSIKIEYNAPENRGVRRYIQKCFVDTQLIKHIKTEDDYRFYEPESDKSKFKNLFPAYISMLEEIESLKEKGWQNFNTFISRYYETYGLGEIAASLLFLLARRYFGDSVRIRKNSTDYVDLNFNDVSIPLDLVSKKYPNAEFQYEPISDEQKKYFFLIHQLFDPKNTEAGKGYGISESYSAIKGWWQGLAEVSKINDFYSGEDLNLLTTFANVESADPYSFVKIDLMKALGFQANEVINEKKLKEIGKKLKDFKELVESLIDQKKEIIRKELKEIFKAETASNVDIIDAIRIWYNKLDQYQKDPWAEYHNHNNDSKPLIKKITSIGNQEEFIFNILPEQFGLDCFENWRNDKTKDYINKIKSGKKIVEDNHSPVGEVKLEFKGKVGEEDGNLTHKGGFEIVVKPENDKDIIYYTEDGSDPADEKSQRKLIKEGEKIPVQGNRVIKFVVKDPSGKYGRTKSYTTVDETQKCKAIREKTNMFGNEMLSFVFPQDESDIKVALESVISEIKSANIITNDELGKIIKELADGIKNKK